MDEIDESTLSEQTKSEMAAGRKAVKENQASYDAAMKARAVEETKEEDPEAQKAVEEAKHFPVTGKKSKN